MMWTFILLAPVILVSCQLSNTDLSTLNRDCHSVYDAVLVVDGSESIGLNNFNTIKRALMEFVNQTLQPNKDVHLGVVLYSTGVVETVNLTSDWAMLDNNINAMAYPARATFTDTGIEAATAMLLEQGRKVVPRILIVVTDGLSSRPDRTLAAADAAKNSSITIYSVGIEFYVKQNADILARYQAELSSIASDEGHVIHLEDFNEFENNAPELAQKFCAVVADVVSGLQNLTVYVGDTFTLTAEMSHTAVVGGNWTLNGVLLSDGGRIKISNNGIYQNLTVEGATLSDAGDYVFTVGGQSAYGYVTVDSAAILQGLVGQTVLEGAQVVFQVTLSQAGITGEWFKDGVSISGDSRYQTAPSGTSLFMFFGDAQVSDSGTYTFTANGQSTSAQLTVTGSNSINGNWGEWSQWSTPGCPASCGSEARHTITRSRSCDSPPPSNGGSSCSGEASQSESRTCGPSTCDTVTITQGLVDQSSIAGEQVVFQVTLSEAGITGEWFKDGVSLNGNSRYQTQSSGTSLFMFFGDAQVSDSGTYTFTANGQSTSAQLTITGSNPINGNWGEWSQWSTPGCPASCGSAARHTVTRSRSCDSPPPSNGGSSCSGEASQSESRTCGPSTCDTVTITQGLVDQSSIAGEQVVFQVTLSEAGITGEWFKNGVSLNGNSRYQTQSSGTSLFMFFGDAQVSDSGTYTFTANGQSTSAQLTITGSNPINGNWGEWSQWSTPGCPASCGSAARHTVTRSRSCDSPPPSNGGSSCSGEASQSESRTCGPSTCDTVTITQGLVDQSSIAGEQVVFQVTLSEAGITGEWFKDGVSLNGNSRYQTQSSGTSLFMFFGDAQVSDSGTYTFTANGQSTSAQLTITGSNPINGNWGEWSQWSTPGCPASCGSAARHTVTRSRSCDSPPPSNGGSSCSGEASQSESRTCGPSTCDTVTITQGLVDQSSIAGEQVVFQVTLSEAGITGEWFKDGVSLNGNSRYQTQSSGTSLFMFFGDAQVSDSGTYTFTANGQSTSAQLTITGSNPTNGNWGEWSQWSTPGCPASCGSAARHTVTRSRSCDSPPPSNGGSSCSGEASQSEGRTCGPSTCDTVTITQGLVDQSSIAGEQVVFQVTLSEAGITGEWFKDGVSLNGNSRYQTQSSGTSLFMFFGDAQVSDSGTYTFTANGQSTSAQLTITGSNPTNGNWGEWSQWSTPGCPASCGSAARHTVTRSRSCDSPPPSNGGSSCSGEASQSESRTCGPSTCDTVTITQGLVDQSSIAGEQVVFQVTLSEAGITGEWFKDGVSLNGNSRYQTQSSGTSLFMFFGDAQVSDSGTYTFTANGQSTSAQLTITGSNPTNGNWGEWSQWSTPGCPASCGSAARHTVTRSRSCDSPPPSNGGSSCSGEASQSESRMCGSLSCAFSIGFTTELRDTRTRLGGDFILTAVVNTTDVGSGQWIKGGQVLTMNNRFTFGSDGTGRYTLRVTGTEYGDQGQYLFYIGGISSECRVTVVDCHSVYDAVLVVDGSESIGLNNFNTIKRALMEFVNQTLQPNKDVHLGVVLYSTGVVETVNLTSDWAMLDNKINAMAYPARSTFTDTGIEAATAMLLEQGRKVVSRILIVVTDGLSSRPDRTLAAADAAKNSSITIYSVGIEFYVNRNADILARYQAELSSIASDEGHVIHLEDFNEFETIAPELAMTFCAVVADVVSGLQNLTVYIGDTFTLTAEMSHTAVVGGTWALNGVALSEGGRVSFVQNGSLLHLTIQGVTAADSGRYSYSVGEKSAVGYVLVRASWATWSDWVSSPCAATCGVGVTEVWRRTRTCRESNGLTCFGHMTETSIRACSDDIPNCYGTWSDWSRWSSPSCPVCGQPDTRVQIYRGRVCNKERQSDEDCPGSTTDSSLYGCTLNHCTNNREPSPSNRVTGAVLLVVAGVVAGLMLV
ncbi:obscurin-like [Haliotis asinina]|uniref:obscurin-like n=1 Tax=Haliotis asinina TaxID=109174 RepID=UPI003532174B